MRFDRVFVDRFGPLEAIDTGPEPLGGLVVVTGPNEAGKTSFFLALRALLHGIYPASRDRNPRTPWSGGDLEIRADVRWGEDEVAHVHRRLLSAPWGRLRRGAEEEDLRNDALPPARRIGREVHEQVFTIGLGDLLRLQDGPGWAAVRDELLSGMGTRDLLSPRDVAQALQSKADSLWRPDRRSRSTADRILSEQMEEASERLLEARERDRELRALHRRLQEDESRLQGLRDRVRQAEEVLEASRRLDPLARRLEVLEARQAAAGDPAELDGLPADPVAQLEGAQDALSEAEAIRSKAREELERARLKASDPDPELEALLEAGDQVESLVARRRLATDLEAQRTRARQDLELQEEGLAREARQLLDPEAADRLARGGTDVLEAWMPARVERALEHLSDTRTRRIQAEEAFHEAEARPDPEDPASSVPGTAVALLVGGCLLLAGSVGGLLAGLRPTGTGNVLSSVPGTLGLVGSALAIVLIFFGMLRLREWRGHRRAARQRWKERTGERQARQERVAETRTAEGKARAELDQTLEGVPLRSERQEGADARLVREIGELQSKLGMLREGRQVLERHGRAEAELEAELEALGEGLPHLRLPDSVAGALESLQRVWDQAQTHADDLEASRRIVEEARHELERADARVAEARAAVESLDGLLPTAHGAADESLRARAVQAAERMQALADARRIRREIEGEAGSLETLRDEVDELGRMPLWRDPGPQGLALRLEEDRSGLEELRAHMAETRAEARRLEESEMPDQVQGELRRLAEERTRVREERDVYRILAQVTRTAEREFREEHQPELVLRAERHLARITGGRYDRLLMGDETDPDRLHLRGPHVPGILPVGEPFSTGIREQVYLSLRLAVLEVLEQDGESLPLVLDEVLVNWDPDRRARGLDLLRELSRERQVFVMTCHPGMADEVEAQGARRVELELPA